jgi:excinuclease ABC subunit C
VRRIKSVEGTDDFAMMREALTRRLTRGLEEGDLPQLLVVDGGKGQLGVALAVCEDLGLSSLDVVGLAKSRLKEKGRTAERVFLPGVRDPITLRPGTLPYRLLTQLRDEAHKTAINAHRDARSATRLKSPLDEVPGVGPVRRKRLLKAFGSLEGVMKAELIALKAVPNLPAEVAEAVYQACRAAREG